MSDGNMMDVDDLGSNMDCFDSGSRHVISFILAFDPGNFSFKDFYKFIIPIFGSKFVF
jgi:hypothetical protein